MNAPFKQLRSPLMRLTMRRLFSTLTSEGFVTELSDTAGDTSSGTTTVTGTTTTGTTTITGTTTTDTSTITETTTTAATTLTDTGTITFEDVDLLDTHTATVTGSVTNAAGEAVRGQLTLGAVDNTEDQFGGLGWTYSVEDGALDDLSEGETRVETFTVALDDGNGGVVEQDVVITITGTNDVATLTSATGTFTESDATQSTAWYVDAERCRCHGCDGCCTNGMLPARMGRSRLMRRALGPTTWPPTMRWMLARWLRTPLRLRPAMAVRRRLRDHDHGHGMMWRRSSLRIPDKTFTESDATQSTAWYVDAERCRCHGCDGCCTNGMLPARMGRSRLMRRALGPTTWPPTMRWMLARWLRTPLRLRPAMAVRRRLRDHDHGHGMMWRRSSLRIPDKTFTESDATQSTAWYVDAERCRCHGCDGCCTNGMLPARMGRSRLMRRALGPTTWPPTMRWMLARWLRTPLRLRPAMAVRRRLRDHDHGHGMMWRRSSLRIPDKTFTESDATQSTAWYVDAERCRCHGCDGCCTNGMLPARMGRSRLMRRALGPTTWPPTMRWMLARWLRTPLRLRPAMAVRRRLRDHDHGHGMMWRRSSLRIPDKTFTESDATQSTAWYVDAERCRCHGCDGCCTNGMLPARMGRSRLMRRALGPTTWPPTMRWMLARWLRTPLRLRPAMAVRRRLRDHDHGHGMMWRRSSLRIPDKTFTESDATQSTAWYVDAERCRCHGCDGCCTNGMLPARMGRSRLMRRALGPTTWPPTMRWMLARWLRTPLRLRPAMAVRRRLRDHDHGHGMMWRRSSLRIPDKTFTESDATQSTAWYVDAERCRCHGCDGCCTNGMLPARMGRSRLMRRALGPTTWPPTMRWMLARWLRTPLRLRPAMAVRRRLRDHDHGHGMMWRRSSLRIPDKTFTESDATQSTAWYVDAERCRCHGCDGCCTNGMLPARMGRSRLMRRALGPTTWPPTMRWMLARWLRTPLRLRPAMAVRRRLRDHDHGHGMMWRRSSLRIPDKTFTESDATQSTAWYVDAERCRCHGCDGCCTNGMLPARMGRSRLMRRALGPTTWPPTMRWMLARWLRTPLRLRPAMAVRRRLRDHDHGHGMMWRRSSLRIPDKTFTESDATQSTAWYVDAERCRCHGCDGCCTNGMLPARMGRSRLMRRALGPTTWPPTMRWMLARWLRTPLRLRPAMAVRRRLRDHDHGHGMMWRRSSLRIPDKTFTESDATQSTAWYVDAERCRCHGCDGCCTNGMLPARMGRSRLMRRALGPTTWPPTMRWMLARWLRTPLRLRPAMAVRRRLRDHDHGHGMMWRRSSLRIPDKTFTESDATQSTAWYVDAERCRCHGCDGCCTNGMLPARMGRSRLMRRALGPTTWPPTMRWMLARWLRTPLRLRPAMAVRRRLRDHDHGHGMMWRRSSLRIPDKTFTESDATQSTAWYVDAERCRCHGCDGCCTNGMLPARMGRSRLMRRALGPTTWPPTMRWMLARWLRTPLRLRPAMAVRRRLRDHDHGHGMMWRRSSLRIPDKTFTESDATQSTAWYVDAERCRCHGCDGCCTNGMLPARMGRSRLMRRALGPTTWPANDALDAGQVVTDTFTVATSDGGSSSVT